MNPLIVVGDSHARALALGARALGYDVASFATSGGAWRDGSVTLQKSGQLKSDHFRARQKIAAFQAETNSKSPLISGTPVVASLGFHVSEFISEFRSNKLGSYLSEDRGGDRQNLLSASFTRAYLQEQRRDMIKGLGKIASKAPLVVVVPPNFRSWPLLRAINAELSAQISAAGATVYNPNDTLTVKGILPDEYKHDDGRHGNQAFGTAVMQAIVDNGLL
ncbi:hypothetical protein KO498_09785 [Lentibacter algarum]|uniref:hypothetical protein n=1 Tax=Lentibacter algarum TaxID=576131 RepID=UPI001C065562|nr:hypothetical protein [Lentibacter algarum]MBU2982101.1 hypothetical protein [Lentibacter algarum]